MKPIIDLQYSTNLTLSQDALRQLPEGAVVLSGTYRNLRFDVKRALVSLTGYVTFPFSFPDVESLPVHGGVTFQEGTPDGYVVGWDYAHAYDAWLPPHGIPDHIFPKQHTSDQTVFYTPQDVLDDCVRAVDCYYNLPKLVLSKVEF